MKLFKGFRPIDEFKGGTVATIGNFDGVHRGHQALLYALRIEADKLGLPLVVILFEPQPGEFFHNDKAPARISSLREKLHALRKAKVDYVYCFKFDNALSTMDAFVFAERIYSHFNLAVLMVGKDFRFGRNRLGDVQLLTELAFHRGAKVKIFPDFVIGLERVSSTSIRRALEEGKLEQAREFLGCNYSMCGRVVGGKGVGKQWGIPTANLNMHRLRLPLKGVFAVHARRSNGEVLSGVANLGTRPTVDGTKKILEIHLFDFDEILYGEILQVFFRYKLRDEIKFKSVEDLIKQIHTDINVAKEWLQATNIKERDFHY
jgi:riboflavin kinase/FMN adenylyltransferase